MDCPDIRAATRGWSWQALRARTTRREVVFAVTLLILLAVAASAHVMDRQVRASRRSFNPRAYDQTMDRMALASATIARQLMLEGVVENLDPVLAAQLRMLEAPAPVPAEPEPDEASAPVEEEPGYRLTGIVWSEDSPLAFVNGKVVGEGDTVGELKVERITKERVTLVDPRGVATPVELYEK